MAAESRPCGRAFKGATACTRFRCRRVFKIGGFEIAVFSFPSLASIFNEADRAQRFVNWRLQRLESRKNLSLAERIIKSCRCDFRSPVNRSPLSRASKNNFRLPSKNAAEIGRQGDWIDFIKENLNRLPEIAYISKFHKIGFQAALESLAEFRHPASIFNITDRRHMESAV